MSIRSKTSHIFPHLQSGSLISIGKLYDDGCTSTFTATNMTVKKQGELVLEGTRNGLTGMWHVQLTPPHPITTPTHESANTFMEYITKPELAQWYHATLFVPINYTLVQSIKKGYFTTSPNLTSKLINKHLTPSMTTSKGHMHQTSKNLKSTKPQDPRTL